jgi:hypothetical protein
MKRVATKATAMIGSLATNTECTPEQGK